MDLPLTEGGIAGLYALIGGLYYMVWRHQKRVSCLIALHLQHHPEDKGIITEACED